MESKRNASALQRLVGRYPTLNQDSTITMLVSKGFNVTNEDIIHMSHKLLLRPELTIVIAGCFRHLLPQMVKSMVDILRESYSQRTMMEVSNKFGKCSISISSWSFCLHEYVAMAFSRLLELAPHLLSTILEYFLFAPPPFERLLHSIAFAGQPTWEATLLDVVRASYRFIQLEPASFENIWDWSPFIELLAYKGLEGSERDVTDIRWCAVQIISLVFKLSDEATRAVSLRISCLTEGMAFSCLLRWEEFCQEIAVEKGGWVVEPLPFSDDLNASEASTSNSKQIVKWKHDMSSQITHVEVCGIELPVRKKGIKTESWPPLFGKTLFPTSMLKSNLKAVALALSQQEPVLLEGPAGCGKTSIIRELGELTGNSDAVYVHLNEQVDGKTLLGTYVCTEVPGDFRWQPGAVTQAVLKGLWLVFEDVNRAPSEVLSALVPLLESRKLYIPGRAETVRAAEGFQLFATVTTTEAVSTRHLPGGDILSTLWRRIVIASPNNTELGSVIEMSFPLLRPVVSKLIETWELVNGFAMQGLWPVDTLCAKKISFGRHFSSRDLLKWCKRLRDIKEMGPAVQPSAVCEVIYREAVDCFAACISEPKHRRLVMDSIARLWGITEEQVTFFECLNKPPLQALSSAVQVGRACLPVNHLKKQVSSRPFAYTGHSIRNLERIAVCIQQQEPVLLVGETGTGKTTLVQHLAEQVSMPLVVMNLSQQSDSADFIGGFKPVEAHLICMKLVEKFKDLFCRTFPSQHNSEFLARVHYFVEKRKLKQLLKACGTAVAKVEGILKSSKNSNAEANAVEVVSDTGLQPKTKRRRPLSRELMLEWEKFSLELDSCQRQVLAAENTFAFTFIEGAFVRALRNGHWILLDELNLAPVETLERLTGVLEGESGSLNLTERGDIKAIPRHPNFRVFACMNPATDVGKHDLPLPLKSRFTEIYVDELTITEDLQTFVFQYLKGLMPSPPVGAIVDFYQQAQQEAEVRLFDSANQKPRYSLRSLARALEYTQAATSYYGFARALYDGVCMTFLTLLDRSSAVTMENLIQCVLFKNLGLDLKSDSLLTKVPGKPSSNHMEFEHFWLERGSFKSSECSKVFKQKYVLTKSIRDHLKNVAKAVFIRRYPVLLQGPTSSGKTSSIEYLAMITGHRFVRINNHEHTDLQEYLGTYVTGPTGKLVFQEGILVEAVRNGYWVVLDELNLAPSEVLEALNRLLDDNRELFVPELQIAIKPHPHFMLFATQNPPGLYGGRKALSRAFRNRFLELHVDDIPEDELCIILEERCEIPRSYAVKMVAVMKDLQRHRQSSQVFAGKHGFITARDLFKWAERHQRSGVSYEDLAKIGYVLLAERLRDATERSIVHDCLEKNLRAKIDVEKLYAELSLASHIQEAKEQLAVHSGGTGFGNIVWTNSMMRLFSLVEHCYKHKEPMLLIGETGCGKTTVCQLLAMIHGQRLHILNCHQHTETADFLGGFRPVRERESIAEQFGKTVRRINSSELFCVYQPEQLPESLESVENTINTLEKVITLAKASPQLKRTNEVQREIISLELFQKELERLRMDWQALFTWQDGPLVQAMRAGDLFLVDEISLADDSVLERLNSVLEPKRLLVLAEKGGSNVEELVAHPNFLVMATMNPGGDFGKKELSPALRNRFTEIWVPPITEEMDLRSIIVARFLGPCLTLTDPILNFWKWYQKQHSGRCLTVRDLLSWIYFINTVVDQIGMYNAFIHGAFLVLLDGIGLGMGFSNESARTLRNKCLGFLLHQIPLDKQLNRGDFEDNTMMTSKAFSSNDSVVGVHPFFIPKGSVACSTLTYELMAPTTSINTFRILRAMQLSKPVLIEGSPGVGKTSLITALASISCHSLVRINLSEQTDMMDLLGSDLPVEGSQGAEFRWSDGVFLQALKSGKWVVLDELNLASQSVLEGLNACLDHRGEVFIPELGRAFKCHPSFRIFACQNPSLQGGGRKSLPRSFLNRFTKVYVETLSEEDFIFISSSLHPSIPRAFLLKLIHFNDIIFKDTMVSHAYGHLGAPWEFNLRDVLRSCALLEGGNENALSFLEVVYLQRMRTAKDRWNVLKLYEEVFGSPACLEAYPSTFLDSKSLKIGKAMLQRLAGPQTWSNRDNLAFLPSQSKCLESLMLCVQHGWMSILVGPPACGKTSVVRLLARLTGTPLQEFALSSGTDTTDLLGCFEQYDVLRSWQKLVKKVHHLFQLTCGCLITADDGPSADVRVIALRKMLTGWSTFEMSCNFQHEGKNTEKLNQENFLRSRLNSLALLSDVLDQIKNVGSMLTESIVSSGSEIEGIENELVELKKNLSSEAKTNHFEWVDGGFLRAVQRGDWVLLENANLCSPTVLDRLNPLLEPNGAILVNERGLVNGNAMVLRAHPNFRLFLTVDPSHGEISRAMRNRGVEIFIMQPSTWIVNAGVQSKDQEITNIVEDSNHYLVQMGIPSRALVSSMSQAHMDFKLVVESCCMARTASIRQLGQWAGLFQQILSRGSGLFESIRSSWDQIYVQGCDDVKKRCAISNICNSQLDQVNATMTLQSSLQLAGGWPRPLKSVHFCRMSKEAITLRDCTYLQVLLAEQVGHHIKTAWSCADGDEKRNLFEWLQSKKNMAVMLPPRLFQVLMYPSSLAFVSPEKDTELGVPDFDKMIIYGSLWMMEQAGSRLANDIRLLWLNAQATNVGVHSNSLVLVCKMLQRKLEHPIFGQMLSAAEECGATEDSHLRKLDVVRRTLLQWQIEDDTCQKFQDSTLHKRRPLLIQSFLYYTSMSRKKLTELNLNDLVEGLYPMFLAVRDLEQEILCCANCLWNDKTCKAYLEFLDSHKAFWKGACNVDTVRKGNLGSNRLFFTWKKLKENAMMLMSSLTNSEDKLEKAKYQAIHLLQGIERLLLGRRSEFKLYLWKHSGHPCVPSSKEAFHQLQALLNFCNKLWPEHVNGTCRTLTSGSPNVLFRCLALEGIGMSLGLLQGKCKDKEGTLIPKGGGTAEAVVVAADILMKLSKRLMNEKSQNDSTAVRIIGCCKCWPSHFLQNSDYREVLLQDSTQRSKLLVFPWLDSLSLIRDSQIVASVTQIASGLDLNDVEDVSFKKLKDELRGVVDFSLQLSSRSPLSFVPHQQILWLINSSAGFEHEKCSLMKEFRNFAHQLRFNWHSSFWSNKPHYDLGFGSAATGADFVFNATNSARLSGLIAEVVPVKQYDSKILELRLAARVLWDSKGTGVQQSRRFDFLHASSVFCQTVLSFASSFQRDEVAHMQKILTTLHVRGGQGRTGGNGDEVQCLKALLRKTEDQRFVALLDSHVYLCLDLLYVEWCTMSPFSDYLSVHGKIWLLLGVTRLKLMLPREAYDPGAKYAHEHAILLEEVSDAKLELQVRQESNSILRGSSLSAKYWEFHSKIEELEQEAMAKASKCVYREQPKNLEGLYHEVGVFIESINGHQDVHAWITALERKTEKAVVDRSKQEVRQWQDVSMEFIQRLTVNYPDYQDLAQPVLLSVFEMKFGLSLLCSAFQQKQSLLQGGLNGHASSLYEALCHLMEYPSRNKILDNKLDHSTIISALPAFYFLNDSILESISRVYGVEEHGKQSFMVNLKMKVFRCAIAHVKKEVLNAGLVHGALLEIVFSLQQSVSVFWNNMRDRLDAIKQEQGSFIRFKHQSHSLDLDIDQDEEAFKAMFPRGFKLASEMSTEACNVEETGTEDAVMSGVSEQDWYAHESALAKELTFLQSQFFGGQAVQERENRLRALSDDERLEDFTLSFDVGRTFLEGTGSLLPASLNERLRLAHMLMFSLKHESLLSPTEKSNNFNIYEDASPSELAPLLKSLGSLQVCLSGLLIEWPEQPSLVQLLRGVESLLSLSIDVPLIKVLTRVEQLLSKAQLWEENAPKHLSLKDVLAGLHHLVSRWRKFELEQWEVLLQKVEMQFELEAEKLWFSLYAVLHPISKSVLESEFEPIIASLEEFMETATLGEFKKRVQMLAGFYGQFRIQQSFLNGTTKILYNVLGYYSKFLPLIEDFIAAGKREIQKELKSFLNLHKWDERNYYALLSSSENTHRKLFKLINKYKLLLSKPALPTVFDKNQPLSSSKKKADLKEKEEAVRLDDGSRSLDLKRNALNSNENWQLYLQNKVQDLLSFISNIRGKEEVAGLLKELPSFLPQFWRLLSSSYFAKPVSETRQRGTDALEDLGTTIIIRSNELRESEKKRLPKKKALVDLLKELRNLGFSHHRSAIPREEQTSKAWILQPACRLDYFFTFFLNVSAGCTLGTSILATEQVLTVSRLWSKACDYYFRNLALIQQLRLQSLSFHKDLMLHEVAAATAYMEHGLYLQQRQRCFAQEFAAKLVNLQNIACQLGTFDNLDDVTILGHPDLLRNWLWRQKDVLDSVYSACLETSLLYKKAEAVQFCSSEKNSPRLAVIVAGLEHAAEILRTCKSNLDKVVILGADILSPDKIALSWPVLITSSVQKMIVDNFSSLLTVKDLIEKFSCESGLSPLWELCGQASKMVDDFKEQCNTATWTTKSEFTTSKEAYKKQREELFSEVLHSVQMITRLTSRLKVKTAADGHHCDDAEIDGMTAKSETIQCWASLMEEQMSGLRLGKIYQIVIATITIGVQLFSCKDKALQQELCMDFRAIDEILELVIAAGLVVFSDYVSLHKSLSKLTYIGCKLFGMLLEEGFCIKESDQEQVSNIEDKSGTGMGEGQGKTDVSHEMEDEDQLLGSTQKDLLEKPDEDKDVSAGKGVEMGEDFEGDLFNVSESDSEGIEEDDNEGQELESKMGEGGENENIVDEKLWGKEDDEVKAHEKKEKYEVGSSVQESGTDLELRAKEDCVDAANDERLKEQGQLDSEQEHPKSTDDEQLEEDTGNMLDKCDAYEPSSGIDPSVETSDLEEADLNDGDDMEAAFDDINESLEDMDLDNHVSGTAQGSESEQEPSDKASDDMDIKESFKDPSQEGTVDNINQLDAHSTVKQLSNQALENGVPHGVNLTDLSDPTSLGQDLSMDLSTELSVQISDFSTAEDLPGKQGGGSDLMARDPEMGLPSASGHQKQISGCESSGNNDSQTLDRLDADPYRRLGDFLKAWKERVIVTEETSPETKNVETPYEDLGSEGMEYQYVMEDKITGAQALGSATSDQIDQSRVHESDLDRNISNFDKDATINNSETKKEGDSKIVDKDPSQTATKRKASDKVDGDSMQDWPSHEEVNADVEMGKIPSDSERTSHDVKSNVSTNLDLTYGEISGTSLMLNSSPYSSEDVQQIRKELEIVLNKDDQSIDKARALWSKYEQLTTRLSQELTEQLRLIMEPTLAARLEGDYRTGKRINLKKVIPYIASQFRRDKIWLRRTKPSKRQYQVVLAIDDSRSMSESHCGHMALEALITICRSMSTLEVGQMAVASFGQKGNVKLLHDFDTPFSTEAGIQMISQFSFKQDNTITDEPVVDLLHYLTWLLDVCAMSTSTPGRHQLRQLILIIADGRFHEKETLRRCIREAVSRGQMLAFIVLDNMRESIMDVQSVSFTGGAPTFSKYIDTFPFPYYILLKNIEELPQTLVDLLRQWFELNQRAKLL